MMITKFDPMLGKQVTLEIDITKQQYSRVLDRFNTLECIQDIIPNASDADREFLISGISPEGWKYFMKQSSLEDYENGD